MLLLFVLELELPVCVGVCTCASRVLRCMCLHVWVRIWCLSNVTLCVSVCVYVCVSVFVCVRVCVLLLELVFWLVTFTHTHTHSHTHTHTHSHTIQIHHASEWHIDQRKLA